MWSSKQSSMYVVYYWNTPQNITHPVSENDSPAHNSGFTRKRHVRCNPSHVWVAMHGIGEHSHRCTRAQNWYVRSWNCTNVVGMYVDYWCSTQKVDMYMYILR